MMDSLLEGYDTFDIKNAGKLADILDTEVIPLLKSNIAVESASDEDALPENDLDAFNEKSDEWGVNPDALIDYVNERGMTLDSIENLVQESEEASQNIEAYSDITTASATTANDELDPYITAPNSYSLSEGLQYNPSTGSFTYREVDAVVPGRNGLDLVIGRIYDSYDDLNCILPGYLLTNEWKQWNYGLGSGWQFMFSSVEAPKNRLTAGGSSTYVHTSDGATYVADFSSSSTTGLKDYKLNDLKFVRTGTNHTNYQYSLYHKDGKTERFNSNGQLTEISDRNGNKIIFTYSGYLIPQTSSNNANTNFTITIRDTLDQETKIVKTGNNLITVTLPDGNKLEYTTYVPAIDTNQYDNAANQQEIYNKQHHYQLRTFKDQYGNVTTYDYQVKYSAYSHGSRKDVAFQTQNYSYMRFTLQYSLKSVEFPSKYSDSEKEKLLFYSELHPVRINTTKSFRDKFFITLQSQRVKNVPLTSDNLKKYQIPDHTGYQANATFKLSDPPSTFEYKNRIRTQIDTVSTSTKNMYNYTYYTINNKGLVRKEETYNGMRSDDPERGSAAVGTLLYSVEREYDLDKKLPTKVTRKDYSGGGCLEQIEQYDYDSWGNVIGYWSPLANGTKNEKNKTTNVYAAGSITPNYCYLTSTSHWQNDSTNIKTEYTYFSDKKNVEYVKIYEGSVLKEKTGYGYDSYGNVNSEKRYKTASGTDYYETGYKYKNGAFLEKITTGTIYDADGTATGTISTSYTYDSMGNKKSSTDGRGYTTIYDYNKRGDLEKITNPDNTTISLTRNYADNTLTIKDEEGYYTRYHFNLFGDEIKTESVTSSGAKIDKLVEREYLFGGELVKEWNDYFTTTCNYDSWGQLLEKKTENIYLACALTSETEKYKYYGAQDYYIPDISGNKSVPLLKTTKTVSNSSGSTNVVTVEYTDVMGNVRRSGYVLGGMEYYTSYVYDYAGNCIKEVSAGGITTSCAYDYAGRLTKTTKANGMYSTNTYNALGNMESSIDFEGNKTVFDYDALDRNIKKWGLLNESEKQNEGYYYGTKYYYDAADNLKEGRVKNSGTDNLAGTWRSTAYTYNNRNRLETVTVAGSQTKYIYDGVGNMKTSTVAYGKTNAATTTYTYDRFGNVLTIKDALGQIESRTYTGIGRPKTRTDRNGTVFTYTLDALGREYTVTAKPSSGSTITTNSRYAPNGELKSKTESGGSGGTKTQEYEYDSAGRLTSSKYNGTEVSGYTYHPDGQRKTFTLTNSGTTVLSASYTYNNVGLLETVNESNVQRAKYIYNGNGLVLTETLPSGIVTAYTYNAFGQPNTETHKLNSTTKSSASYTYYLDGNLRTKSGTEPTRAYTYDTAGRLKSESETGGLTLTYSYEDNRGNRTKMAATGTESYTTSYTYDSNNRLTLESKTQGSSAENTRYTYDSNGNQISKFKMVTASSGSGNPNIVSGAQDGEINTYNPLGQLTELIAGTSKSQYVYRPDGLRASKTVNGTTTRHLWDLTDMVAEIGSSTTAYLRGNGLAYSKTGATGYYYRRNAHGDVYQKLNTSGSVAKTYKYDAFGNEVSPDANDTNPWRYCGEYFDKESGRVYLRARYYNPTTGRFSAEDSYPGKANNPLSLNLYTYCYNNPIRYIDPSGHDPVPGWAKRINKGTGTDEDYAKAQSVSHKSWAGFARNAVNKAIKIASYYKDFKKQRNELAWYTQTKSLINTSKALSLIVAKYDNTITSVSDKQGVPKSMIQAVLFRELICFGVDDIAKDYMVFKGIASDSSTGLGQVTAKTAMTVHNPDNISRSEMWNSLQNSATNIEYVARILEYEAKVQYGNEKVNLYEINDEMRINVFGAYNAGPHYATSGAKYGIATNEYYKLFVQMNNS